MVRVILFFTILVFSGFLQCETLKKTICLNMIVKDESPVIRRCLSSVKGLIDYWVIVDTGSTDGTQEIIKEYMKQIPGDLFERPWVDFAHNRNEALSLARGKADYILFIDADEQLIFSDDFQMPSLEADYYSIQVQEGKFPVTSQRIHLIKDLCNWKWVGVLHERLASIDAKVHAVIPGVYRSSETTDGHRAQDPEKYRKDALVLEKALLTEPDNSRYVFYLAQSYFNYKDYEKALKNYEKRALMADEENEVFFSLYMVGKCKQLLQHAFDDIIKAYTQAYLYRPSRAEPLYRIGALFLETQQPLLAYAFLELASTISLPEDLSFVEKAIYEYGTSFHKANAAALLGKWKEAFSSYVALKERKDLPLEIVQAVDQNMASVKTMLEKQEMR